MTSLNELDNYNVSNFSKLVVQKKVNENGRIDLISNNNLQNNNLNNGTALFLQDKTYVEQKTNYNNSRNLYFEKSNLEKIYMSKKNMDQIQNDIIVGVYNMSNGEYRIDHQDYDTLEIIMRSIFLQYSLNNPDDIKNQIIALNKLVVEHCVPKIYNEVEAYMKYKRDVSRISIPPNLPKSTNYKNTGLEFKNFF